MPIPEKPKKLVRYLEYKAGMPMPGASDTLLDTVKYTVFGSRSYKLPEGQSRVPDLAKLWGVDEVLANHITTHIIESVFGCSEFNKWE